MESMTGYGRASAERDGLRITVELRGVNHKGLDLHTVLPSVLLRHELDCRKALRAMVCRGHVDTRVTCEFVGEQAVEARVAEGVALALGRQAAVLARSGALSGGMTFGDLLSLPGAVQVDLGPGMEERAGELLGTVLAQALDGFMQTRRIEGERLAAQFGAGVAALEAHIAGAEALKARQVEGAREALAGRIRQMDVSVDPARIEQEVALAAQRADVTEEVVRMAAHVKALAGLLRAEAQELGRRLDHLLQEMQREVSTLLAKSNLMELTQLGLEMRLVVEQLREQAQNVA